MTKATYPLTVRVKARLLSLAARRKWQPFWRLLHRVSIGGMGHMNADPALNGEIRCLRSWAESMRSAGRDRPVVLDVGANEGDFAAQVLELMPHARVHCFEPHPATSARLSARFSSQGEVVVHSVAVAQEAGRLVLHDYLAGTGSAHASLLASTFTDLYAAETVSIEVPVVCLDDVLSEHALERVDLVKIDVEGFERSVLLGMKQGLSAGRVDRVQFEFNAHNALTGFTLHEVGQLLFDFDIYKIVANGLVPVLGAGVAYDSQVEVFKYANYVAQRRKGPTG